MLPQARCKPLGRILFRPAAKVHRIEPHSPDFVNSGRHRRGPLVGEEVTVPAVFDDVQDAAAGTRTLFVNGVQVASGAAQAGDGMGALWIGGAETTAEFFAGKIDDVRIYRAPLSSATLSALTEARVTLNGTGGNDIWTVRVSADDSKYEFFNNATATGTPAPHA